MKLGIIADDNTGATDAAGMLTARGIRTLLLLQTDRIPAFHREIAGFEAVVVGSRIRSLPAGEAYALTRRVLGDLLAAGCDKIQLKYCSTFDSTREGNIGPSLDACLDLLGQRTAVVCPSLPVNGRRVYQGLLFVGQTLLSESPLRQHPLNPMTDANLVRWLRHQTKRTVGLIPLETLRSDPHAVAARFDAGGAAEPAYWVVDAIDDGDLLRIAEATRDQRFVSGGSGITIGVAATHFPDRPPLDFRARLGGAVGSVLVASGSQSPATRAQNDWALAHGFTAVSISASGAVRGEIDVGACAGQVSALLARKQPVLLRADTGMEDAVQAVQALGRSLGCSAVQTGERIVATLGTIVRRTHEAAPLRLLIVSGGETSGAVGAALGIEAVEVGLNVAPGVPYTFPLDGKGPVMVLKSGNFGGVDFYDQVMRGVMGR